MSRKHFWNQNPAEKFFPLPNDLFRLELLPGEIAVYAYLMYRENRETFQCHPSYTNIGKAVAMSPNTVRKYVQSLEEKHLIYTEPTTVVRKDGAKRNGSLLYTIRPIEEAKSYMIEREWEKIEQELDRAMLKEAMKNRQVS